MPALDRLAELHAAARGRISLMPGSGITPGHDPHDRRTLPVTEMHASASEPAPGAVPRIREFGFDGATPRRTSAEIVRALQRAWREVGQAKMRVCRLTSADRIAGFTR